MKTPEGDKLADFIREFDKLRVKADDLAAEMPERFEDSMRLVCSKLIDAQFTAKRLLRVMEA